MHDPAVGPSSDSAGQSHRLESWKEIAAYFGRGVTTVQRWEQLEGLPVHRLPHAKKGSIFALKSELDAWRSNRESLGERSVPTAESEGVPVLSPETGERSPAPARRRAIVIVAGTVLAVAISTLAMVRVLRPTDSAPVVGAAPAIPKPLANDAADERCPSLSPDGSQVIYHWRHEGAPGLYIKSVSRGSPRRLSTGNTAVPFECGYAKWSPAGDLVAFLGRGEGDSKTIWVVSPAGGEARRLTSASGIDLSWTPDGQTVAFVDRNSRGEPFSIFAIPVRGGPRRRLTTPPLGDFGDTFAAFSPDGRRLAVVRYGARYQSDLLVMNVDAPESALDRLTTGFSGIEGIVWTLDGRLIVFGSHEGLWKIDVTRPGEKPVRVAAFDGGAKYPTLSRAGEGAALRLAYQSDIIDVNVWRWDVRRRQAMKVAGSTLWDDFPAIAAAGDRVAFASNRTGANEIWSADVDGSNPQQLTFHRGPVVASPQWSPDGARLAFSSQLGDNRDIYVMRADGSESTRLTTGPSEDTNPSWSRDGQWIYFRSDRGGIGQIWKAPAAGGTAVRVTTGEALEGYESPNGKLLYFVRSGDAPGLWSVSVQGGEESPIAPHVRGGYWGVADKGVYFVISGADVSTDSIALGFFDFATGTVTTIAPPPVPTRIIHSGFSVSRDGRLVLWTQRDNAIRDLMLIDGWNP
jgi:Tol biopolymer transport system component